ncbi:hypothetical protein GCM10023195_16410 [Actinoallomurus liliacearum]|uniref:Uncharacterized protein n=1 Tax=Actinoallomurus liliacearum TaxID=1080073 RepID=A0ABP8TFB7_9ACTN
MNPTTRAQALLAMNRCSAAAVDFGLAIADVAFRVTMVGAGIVGLIAGIMVLVGPMDIVVGNVQIIVGHVHSPRITAIVGFGWALIVLHGIVADRRHRSASRA